MESRGRAHSLPFASVLVARAPNENPSELELQMRSHCQKLRVLEKLSGGAHLLLPGSDTIAIRTYNQDTIRPLNVPLSIRDASVEEINQWHADQVNSIDHHQKKKDTGASTNNKLDGILSFREYFKYTVVFFILSDPQAQQEQLDRSDSFFHRVQYAMTSGTGNSNSTNTHGSNNKTSSLSLSSEKVSRVFIVPDAACAVQTLSAMVESLTPAKRKVKQQYFDREASRYFLPFVGTANNHSTSSNTETAVVPVQQQQQQPPEPNGAVSHITRALHSWGKRFDISPGEINVILSILGNVSNIATADRDILQNIPVDDTTKEILLRFFGSEGKEGHKSQQQQQQVAGTSSASSPPRSGMIQPRPDGVNTMMNRPFSRTSTSPYTSSSHAVSGRDATAGANHHNQQFASQTRVDEGSGWNPNPWMDSYQPTGNIHRPTPPPSIAGNHDSHEIRQTQQHNSQPPQRFLSYFEGRPSTRTPSSTNPMYHHSTTNLPHDSSSRTHAGYNNQAMPSMSTAQQRRMIPMRTQNQHQPQQQPITFPPQQVNYPPQPQHAQYNWRGSFPGPQRHHPPFY